MTRPQLMDLLLIVLVLAGGIFAAWEIAGGNGVWCWSVGAADIVIARGAWRLLRAN